MPMSRAWGPTFPQPWVPQGARSDPRLCADSRRGCKAPGPGVSLRPGSGAPSPTLFLQLHQAKVAPVPPGLSSNPA